LKKAEVFHNNNEPITLMLLGGGIRCLAFIGALSAIEEMGINIGKIVVASGGSVVGSIYATGKSPLETKKIAIDLDDTIFRDFSIKGLIRGKGLYEGKRFEKWIDEKLDGRKFSDDFRIKLYVMATDMLSYKPVAFSSSTVPDMKVSKAVRFSIGIPWVYTYEKFYHHGTKHILVDGNLMTGVIEDTFEDHGRMLILRIVSQKALSSLASKRFTLKRYFQGLLLIQLHAVEGERVKQSKWNDTILIFCGDIPPTKFSLSLDEKNYLFEQGYQQTKKYIECKWKI
jgi:NTE family protein